MIRVNRVELVRAEYYAIDTEVSSERIAKLMIVIFAMHGKMRMPCDTLAIDPLQVQVFI